MQKIYRDTTKTVTLWDLGGQDISLTFTEEMLRDAGYTAPINIFDMQQVFQCNVTISETINHSVHIKDKE